MATFVDRTLICLECGKEFLFSAGEQQFFTDKGFRHDPKRCKQCKAKLRTVPHRRVFKKRETLATCSLCGRQTTIPFHPTQGRPVFCRECFAKQKEPPSELI